MALWPAGWRQVGYAATEAQGWRAAVRSTARTPALFTEKEACAIVQRYRPATALTPVTPANCSGYRYIVDMGRELQGRYPLVNTSGESASEYLPSLHLHYAHEQYLATRVRVYAIVPFESISCQRNILKVHPSLSLNVNAIFCVSRWAAVVNQRNWLRKPLVYS